MKFAFLLFAFALTTTSLANAAGVGGDWIGWGTWNYDGSGADCNMTLTYQEDEQKVERVKGLFDCGIVALHSGPGEWTRQGNDLYIGETKEGSYDGTDFMSWETIDDGVRVQTTMAVEGNHMDYKELWYGKAGNLIYDITGRFFRKGSPRP